MFLFWRVTKKSRSYKCGQKGVKFNQIYKIVYIDAQNIVNLIHMCRNLIREFQKRGGGANLFSQEIYRDDKST